MMPSYLNGTSLDVHALEAGEGIKLCLTLIPCKFKIKAHSDGDVAVHALSEAIFLALGEGDLGEHFPTKSPKTLNMDSALILKSALDVAKCKGYTLSNVTLKILLERPKLYEYKNEMKKRLSEATGLDLCRIGLAVGTYEGLGPVGRGKAIEAIASVALEKIDHNKGE